MNSSTELATWVLENYPYRDSLNHLKLQKLLFYCFGAVLAFDQDAAVGSVTFQPWEHGPVNREVWSQYRHFRSGEIPVLSSRTVQYAPGVSSNLGDALAVYGLLDAWRLRQQSHLETPWADAYRQQLSLIDTEVIRRHFASKLTGTDVQAPEYLLDTGTFRLDNIPVQGFPSFSALASSLRNEFKDKTRLV